MEKNHSHSHSHSYPQNFNYLPSINPRFGNRDGKFEKPRNTTRYGRDFVLSNSWKEMKPKGSSEISMNNKMKLISEKDSLGSMEAPSSCNCRFGSTGDGEGTPEKRSAKSRLFEICTANGWKPPLFECCQEEGPGHAKMFNFKVIVEMGGASGTVLESYGASQTRKKVAAEHAAEGALWYLKHSGCNWKK